MNDPLVGGYHHAQIRWRGLESIIDRQAECGQERVSRTRRIVRTVAVVERKWTRSEYHQCAAVRQVTRNRGFAVARIEDVFDVILAAQIESNRIERRIKGSSVNHLSFSDRAPLVVQAGKRGEIRRRATCIQR